MEIAELAARHGLAMDAEERLERLMSALAAEPDPHTTAAVGAEAVRTHLADSLAALELPEVAGAARIADVGAGAGFPGLALAVALPLARVDLIEAAGRKCALIGRLAAAGGVDNATAVHARAEEHAAGAAAAYDLVTARAVASLPVLVEYAAPLLQTGGVFVAWKGRRDAAEESSAARAAAELGLERGRIEAVEPFPGVRDRHLHLYSKVKDTPDGFPRRPGMAAKRPLG